MQGKVTKKVTFNVTLSEKKIEGASWRKFMCANIKFHVPPPELKKKKDQVIKKKIAPPLNKFNNVKTQP